MPCCWNYRIGRQFCKKQAVSVTNSCAQAGLTIFASETLMHGRFAPMQGCYEGLEKRFLAWLSI